MSARVVLVSVPVHKISSEHGMGYQMPLWAVSIGGPLIDAGHHVTLIDADVRRLSLSQICDKLRALDAEVVMLGHPASTPAYRRVAATATFIRQRLPYLRIVYGGVFPTFAYQAVMQQCPAIDFIVRGEGEATATELVDAIDARSAHKLNDFRGIPGIVWRRGREVVVNRERGLIQDLDEYRFAWELVEWDLYSMFGMGRSAAIQFSRGCTYRCDYCGQWQFWQKYRHRSVERFVDELALLREKYGVTHIAPSDEHFFADRETSELLLQALIARGLDISLYVNTTVKDVLRDRDLVELYPEAGISFVTLGVESDDPEVQRKIHKNNGLEQSIEAIGLLRRNKMVTLIHMIYGLEDESWRTIARKIGAMMRMNADFVNHEYIMPHFWTPLGSAADPARIVQPDLQKWDYRNQVVEVPGMSPGRLFWAVKLSELIVHSRPKGVARLLLGSARATVRGFRRRGGLRALRVWLAEVAEFYLDRSIVPAGAIAREQQELLELGLGLGLRPGLRLGPGPGPGTDLATDLVTSADETPSVRGIDRCPLRRIARSLSSDGPDGPDRKAA